MSLSYLALSSLTTNLQLVSLQMQTWAILTPNHSWSSSSPRGKDERQEEGPELQVKLGGTMMGENRAGNGLH